LPALAQRVLLLAALFTPAVASIWKHLSGLGPEPAGRPALRALAVTCLGGATLAGLVWTIGISAGDVINNLSTQLLNFLSVPIALLLVAAGSAGRPSLWRSND
jgi:membrane protein DedA with SNARE-associated domain